MSSSSAGAAATTSSAPPSQSYGRPSFRNGGGLPAPSSCRVLLVAIVRAADAVGLVTAAAFRAKNSVVVAVAMERAYP